MATCHDVMGTCHVGNVGNDPPEGNWISTIYLAKRDLHTHDLRQKAHDHPVDVAALDLLNGTFTTTPCFYSLNQTTDPNFHISQALFSW